MQQDYCYLKESMHPLDVLVFTVELAFLISRTTTFSAICVEKIVQSVDLKKEINKHNLY